MALKALALQELALVRGPKNWNLCNRLASGEIDSAHAVHLAKHIKNDRGKLVPGTGHRDRLYVLKPDHGLHAV
jgi:hypothetical protein